MKASTISTGSQSASNLHYLNPHKTIKAYDHLSIPVSNGMLPIELTISGKFPAGAGKYYIEHASRKQRMHPEYVDEYNETSALIGKTNFERNDPTAVYTFSVDTRDLVFHRHAGHRVITGITGNAGTVLKFSHCSPEEAEQSPQEFINKMIVVNIPGDRVFTLRFNGMIYHQFCPMDRSEHAFFAISVHTDEAGGLPPGEILNIVHANKGSIPLLTEPASDQVMELLAQPGIEKCYPTIDLDFRDN